MKKNVQIPDFIIRNDVSHFRLYFPNPDDVSYLIYAFIHTYMLGCSGEIIAGIIYRLQLTLVWIFNQADYRYECRDRIRIFGIIHIYTVYIYTFDRILKH